MSKRRIASHEGNKPSFDQLFVNYRPMMVFYARHLIKNEVVAEDLVTEVFVKCWKKQNDFANEFAALAFLRVSTRNAWDVLIRSVSAIARLARDVASGGWRSFSALLLIA